MSTDIYTCLDCGYEGSEVGQLDECYDCNERYDPADSEDCPHCGSAFYSNTCPECESANVLVKLSDEE